MGFFLLAASPFVCVLAALVLIGLSEDDRTLRIWGVGLLCLSTPAAGIMTALLTAMFLNA